MIGIKDIYNIYIDNLRNNILSYENLIFNLNSSKKYLLGKLTPYKLYIDNFTKINYDNIDSLKLIIRIEDDIFISKATSEEEIVNRINFVNIINNISSINSKLNKVNLELNKLNNRNQSYNVFKFIIGQFNKKNSTEILKGETLSIGFKLGEIRIQKKRRYKGDENVESMQPHNYKVVNWGESNKLKQELIDKGLTPYKAIKDEEGNIIGDNGGHKWLIYFTDDYSYWWYWHKNSKTMDKGIWVKNARRYSFLPSKGKIGNRVALQNLLKNDLTAHLNFTM